MRIDSTTRIITNSAIHDLKRSGTPPTNP
jgi:hypothetical protein